MEDKSAYAHRPTRRYVYILTEVNVYSILLKFSKWITTWLYFYEFKISYNNNKEINT